MKKLTPCSLLLALGLLALANTGNAQIVTYDIGAIAANATTVPETLNVAGITASDLGIGASVGLSKGGSDNGDFGFSGWSTAFNANQYYEFTITPDNGQQIAYSTVSYALYRDTSDGPGSWQLRSSADNFTTSFTSTTLGTSGSTQEPVTANVSSLGTRSTAVTFRLYGFGDGSAGFDVAGLANSSGPILGGTGGNLLINGTVSPVPEPQQYAFLAGLGLIAFAAYRRFKVQKA